MVVRKLRKWHPLDHFSQMCEEVLIGWQVMWRMLVNDSLLILYHILVLHDQSTFFLSHLGGMNFIFALQIARF